MSKETLEDYITGTKDLLREQKDILRKIKQLNENSLTVYVREVNTSSYIDDTLHYYSEFINEKEIKEHIKSNLYKKLQKINRELEETSTSLYMSINHHIKNKSL